MQTMNKSKMFFTALAMVVLTGCSTTNHLRHEVVDQLWCSPQVVEYFPAGGVDLENVVAQYYMASASQGRLALVSTNTTALCLRGNFVSFDRSIYDSVTAIEWDTMKDENRLSGTIDDDSQSVEMNEVYVQRVLESLSHFPRLKYLTLNFSGDDEMAMLTVSLAKLSKLKELEYLKLEGVDELFVGFPELAGKMKLKSLVFDGHIDWRMLGGDDHLKTLDLTTMASTFVFWDDSKHNLLPEHFDYLLHSFNL